MKAVVYKGGGEIALEERPHPRLVENTDAIVQVTLTTICSSDIHIKHGTAPKAVPGVVLGHEFVGRVVEGGRELKTIRPGDRVAVNVETFCGRCFYCKRGFVNNCSDPLGGWSLGCRIDGGQAQYVRIPYADNCLTKIPEGVSDEAALFAGDLLATGYWAAKLGELEPASAVLVIGAGPAGLCAMMCARLYGPARIIAVDPDRGRLETARRNGLADLTYDPSQLGLAGLTAAILEQSHGRGADAVFEMAGGKDTFEMAWRLARPNAVVVLAAMYEQEQSLPLPDMYGKNLIFKTGGVDGNDCEEILQLIAAGKLDSRCLITHRTDFAQIMEAYEIFENKKEGVMKYAIRVS